MTPAQRKQLQRERAKAGLVRFTAWIPKDKLQAVKDAVEQITGGNITNDTQAYIRRTRCHWR